MSKFTLCWSCEKCCGGYDCEWAKSLKPVEGWEAIFAPISGRKARGQRLDSYFVIKCPKYVKSKRRKSK